jgi:hypothetical protein
VKRSTPVHVKRINNAPDILISDSGEPLSLQLAATSGVTLVVDDEAGTFTLTVPDSVVEE